MNGTNAVLSLEIGCVISTLQSLTSAGICVAAVVFLIGWLRKKANITVERIIAALGTTEN